MSDIIKQVKFLFVCVIAFFAVLYVLQIIDATSSIFIKAYGVDPIFGYASLAAMLFVYVLIIFIPLKFLLSLPKTLQPPKDENSEQYQLYLDDLRTRLQKNKNLQSFSLQNNEDIALAYQHLDAKANEEIKLLALTVFVSTGISQNGKLDGLLLISAQIQIVWRVAYIYNQRPSIKDILKIYSYVFANAFIASSLEDLDIGEQIQPVINAAIADSALGAIPFAHGISSLTSIITESIIDGAANAYMTLRLGKIATFYFNPFVSKSDVDVRRTARKEAVTMLAVTVKEGANTIRVAIWGAAKKTAGTAGTALVDASMQAAGAVSNASKKVADVTFDASKQAVSSIGSAASKTASSVGDASKKVAGFVKDTVSRPKNNH